MKQHSFQLRAVALVFALALPGLCLAAASPVLTLTSTTEQAGPPSCVVLNYTLAGEAELHGYLVETEGVGHADAEVHLDDLALVFGEG